MKIRKNKKNNKKLLLLLLAVIALVALALFYFSQQVDTPISDMTGTNKKSDSKDNQADKESRPLNDISYDKPSNEEQNPTLDSNNQNTPNNPEAPESISKLPVTITAANQNGNQFQSRVMIGSIINNGTCTLTLERSGQNTVSQTAPTFISGNITTCQGFDTDISGLQKGNWKLTISVESESAKGTTSQEIKIE